MTLKDAKPSERVVVEDISETGALKRRILDMGITKGSKILVKRTAPLGDPIEIIIRGYILSLRKEEAEKIYVRRA